MISTRTKPSPKPTGLWVKTGGKHRKQAATGGHSALSCRRDERLRSHAHRRLFRPLTFGVPLKTSRVLIDGRPAASGGVQTKGFVVESTGEQGQSMTVEVPDQVFELSLIAEAQGALPSTASVAERRPATFHASAQDVRLLIGVSR